jgi:hypothetical protein
MGNIPKKERFLAGRLRDFIENDKKDTIAVIAGIRKVGKTTILNQLEDYYSKNGLTVVKISLDGTSDDCAVIDEINEKKPNLLLLDEISFLDNYEMFSQTLYNMTTAEYDKRFKVVITGSSSAHIIKLKGTKLGCRSKLFRLLPMTFVEYLYFTGRIKSYSDYGTVKNEDFSDYLQLKGLEEKAPGLAMTFDEEYFADFYGDIELSNRQSHLTHSITNLGQNDLTDIINIMAYKLNEAKMYKNTMRPKVGGQEHHHLAIPPKRTKITWSKIDLSDTIMEDSVKAVPGIKEEDIGRILHFLLWAGIADIEYRTTDPSEQTIDAGRVLNILANAKDKSGLENLFAEVSVCMTSPLYYTRIGEELMRRMKVPAEELYKGTLYGKMLEIYLRGAIAARSVNSILTSHKLNYLNGEIDICDIRNRILLESSAGDKDNDEVYVQDYYPEHDFVRICSSKTKDYFDKKHRFYHIPHAKLCCMADTGDIFKLRATNMADDLDADTVSREYKTNFGGKIL